MTEKLAGSFRDPNGFLYQHDGKLYRQVNKIYKTNYEHLIDSGLYESLSSQTKLISHSEVQVDTASEDAYITIEPELLPHISYPYEWCFSQLKDAALLTLEIQSTALSYGMTLKDASAYNVQFKNCKPIFIDTLSFEEYTSGNPWSAYKQFCQHFLAPLALMSHVDIRLSQLYRVFIDGIPLDLASKMLPLKTKFNPALFLHLHLHAKSQNKYADSAEAVKSKNVKIKETGLLGIIDGLKRCIEKMQWKPQNTEWGDYYEETNYSDHSKNNKKKIVKELASLIKPKSIWDLGANTGDFSREVEDISEHVISWDIDDAAVEKHYLKLSNQSKSSSILPLRLDLTNPSNSLGWAENERDSLKARGKADLLMALALVHHLAISNNVPLKLIAEYFSELGHNLIIEFVPKSDSQTKKLLSSREDIFPTYNIDDFKSDFQYYFDLKQEVKIDGSERTLFLFSSKKGELKS